MLARLTNSAMMLFTSLSVLFLAEVRGTTASLKRRSSTFQSTVFRGGATTKWGTQYSCFRVPSVVRPSGGNETIIIAFAEARIGSCDDQAPKDIVSSVSRDGGATWDPAQLVVTCAGCSNRSGLAGNSTFRNPYAVVLPGSLSVGDGAGDVVLLNYVDTTGPNWRNFQVRSSDLGVSWSDPEPVNLEPWEGVLPGSGTGIVLGLNAPQSPFKGRIVECGATGYEAGHAMHMPIWFSDDDGKSYTIAATPKGEAFPKLEECQLAELSDGTLIINARTTLSRGPGGCNCRAVAMSTDGGASWKNYTFVPQLTGPVCMAGLVAVVADPGTPSAATTLYFSLPGSTTERVNMTVKRSVDGGSNWEVVSQIWDGPSAYSCMLELSTQEQGVLYERGTKSPYEEMVFAVLQTPARDAIL